MWRLQCYNDYNDCVQEVRRFHSKRYRLLLIYFLKLSTITVCILSKKSFLYSRSNCVFFFFKCQISFHLIFFLFDSPLLQQLWWESALNSQWIQNLILFYAFLTDAIKAILMLAIFCHAALSFWLCEEAFRKNYLFLIVDFWI